MLTEPDWRGPRLRLRALEHYRSLSGGDPPLDRALKVTLPSLFQLPPVGFVNSIPLQIGRINQRDEFVNPTASEQRLLHRPHLRAALGELGLRHLRIKPGRPRANGRAERFIQTLLNEWASNRIYGSSAERSAAFPHFLDRYNYRRPHGSLG
jgi:hypothetical protein